MQAPLELDDRCLRDWPLPLPDDESDKEERGRTLIVAGSRELPGAALLAADAVLRAGSGKLMIAAPECVAAGLALAVPESRVIALPQTAAGAPSVDAVDRLAAMAGKIDAVLIGPGLQDESGCQAFIAALRPHFSHAALMLDAVAMTAGAQPHANDRPLLMTPHAGEMAHLSGVDKEVVLADPLATALEWSARWKVVLALKGATTVIASPDGRCWRHRGGNVGLATSGSGDVLAGLIVGLLARGAPLEQAAAWGVVLHARAGARLQQRFGPLGFLARELSAEVPSLLRELGPA